MKEISVILKSNILVTIEEFRILDKYTCHENVRTLVYRNPTYLFTQRTIEYVFDEETLTFFTVVSQNILAYWDFEYTKDLGPNDEFQIKDSLFIRPYYKNH